VRTRSEPMSAAPQTNPGAVVAAVERRMAQVSAGCRQVKRAPFAPRGFGEAKDGAHRLIAARARRDGGAEVLSRSLRGWAAVKADVMEVRAVRQRAPPAAARSAVVLRGHHNERSFRPAAARINSF
jgi:hypothetical protein